MLKTHWLWGCLFAFITGSALADPFTITPLPPAGGFPGSVEVGKSATIQYVFTNNMRVGSKAITVGIISLPQKEFAITSDTCNGSRVSGGGTCKISITFTPITPSPTPNNKSVQITLQDGANTYKYVPIPAVAIPGYTPSPPTVTISGEVIEPLPESMDLNANPKPFKFQFKNTGNGDATGVSVTSTNPDFNTDCVTSDNTTLKAGGSCTASGSFSPTTVNQGIVSATFNFNQGKAVTATTSTKINQPDLSGELEGKLKGAGLPGRTVINKSYFLTFLFKNTTKNPVNVSQRNKFDQFTVTTNNCPDNNQPLPAGKNCIITGQFSTKKPGNFFVEAVLVPLTSPPAEKSVSTSTTVDSEGGQRKLTLTNKCNFDVWFSMSGNEVPNSVCKSQEDCNKNFPGSSCNLGSSTCFWSNYGPDVKENGFKLNKGDSKLSSAKLTVQDPPGNAEAIWEGTISASTGCQGNNCKTAACNNAGGTTACAPGVPFQGPATVVNMKFMRNAADIYSIQVINGFHIPIQIKPNGKPANTYECGISGSFSQQGGSPNSMGACIWKNAVVPQAGQYYWVFGNTPCTNNTCSDNKLCGLNSNMDQVCGDFLGYWTPHKACTVDPKKADKYFHCNTSIAITPEDKTTVEYRQLYSCASNQSMLGSCYEDATANDTCCGCVDWQKLAAPDNVMVPGSTKLCKNPHPAPEVVDPSKQNAWSKVSLPTLRWMKKACPSYAVYPFDTESSTYHCANNTDNKSQLNTVDYTITFCEGDKTGGLPAKKADGRATP